MDQIRVGIVGCGEVTQIIHLPSLYRLSDQFTVTANWPLGAALSFLMLGAVLLICLALYPAARKRMEGL